MRKHIDINRNDINTITLGKHNSLSLNIQTYKHKIIQ